MAAAPILDNKFTSTSSVFAPAALLREARRQKGLGAADVPSVCVLDPDGDLVAFARANVRVLCLAPVTNTMGPAGDDFEKGRSERRPRRVGRSDGRGRRAYAGRH